ncbi:MAG: YMGG-like glycine zipper-containing protein [Deltaproteobacteria bacterium]
MKGPGSNTARTNAVRACIAGVALLVATACGDRSAKARATADSDLARDLALAGSQPVAQPTFQDTTVAPAPTAAKRVDKEPPAPVRTHTARQPKRETPRPVVQTPAPQPAPTPVLAAPVPAPAPAAAPAASIGAGSGMALTSGSKVCTSTNLPGDKLVATVNEAVTGSNGAVIPAGSSVVLEVASVTPGDNGQNAQITFRVRSVVVNDKTYNVSAEVTPLTPLEKTKVAGDPNADRNKVIGGAIAGALIGQIIGHNTKGTVIGAAAGAATGAAVAKSGQKWEGCLPAGAAMRLTLNSALIL